MLDVGFGIPSGPTASNPNDPNDYSFGGGDSTATWWQQAIINASPGVGTGIGGLLGGGPPVNNTYVQAPPAQSSNTTTWIIIGLVGFFVVGGLVFMLLRK